MPTPTTLQTTESEVRIEAAAGDGKGLPRFEMIAYNGGLINVRGWDYPIGIELSGVKAEQKTPIRADHSSYLPVGHTEAVEIDQGNRTISAKGVISRDNEHSRDIVSSGKAGFPWQASVGLGELKATFIDEGETGAVNGQQVAGPFYHITASRLFEISFVEHGADSGTAAKIAAKKPQETAPMHEQTPPAGEQAPAPTTAPTTAQAASTPAGEPLALIADARRERERRSAIEASAAQAIRDGADIDQVEALHANATADETVTARSFERDMLLLSRPQAQHRQGHPARDDRSIEAALAITAGLENPEKHYDEQVLNAADSAFSQGLSLVEAMQIYAARSGYTGPARDVRSLLQAAFSTPAHVQAAGFSTLSLPGILSNVANKFLAEGFNSVEKVWQLIAAIRSVRDFKQVTSYSLTGDLKFDKVGPAGELEHGKLGEETYTNKVDTYGKMFALTRQDIINDDLGALTAVPRRIGRGAHLKLNEVFWAVFLADGAVFTSDKKNYIEGAATALSGSALDTANTKFKRQTDPDGNPLGVRPAILLTAVELEATALELMNSQLIVSGSSSKTPNSNIWQGRFTPAATQYLTAAKAWYLIANPSELPLIEVAFLNGRRVPMVESADADFNQLGVQMRGYFDFGVAHQEHRAGVKAKGEA